MLAHIFFARISFPISLRLSILESLNLASTNKDTQIVLNYEHWVQVNEPILVAITQGCSLYTNNITMRNTTNNCMYRYVNLLYYKQRSMLRVSATCCGRLQGGVL